MAEARRDSAAPGIGIVGAGLMGRWHAHAAARIGARLVGIVDLDRDSAAALARRHAGARPLESLDALLDESALEVVHLCTPCAGHADQIRQLLERRVHVLAEKPLASSADEVRRLLELAAGCGVLLCPVHQMVFQRGVERTAAVLPRLGEICQVSFVICSSGGAGREGLALDAIVGEILPHPLSLLVHLWPDEPLRPEGWTLIHPRAGEVMLAARHAAAVLSCRISMDSRPTRMELVVQASRGSIEVDLFHGFAAMHGGTTGRWRKILRPFADAAGRAGAASCNLALRTIAREPAYPGLRALIRRFYSAVRGAAPPPFAAQRVLEVALARDVLLDRLGLAYGATCPWPREHVA